MNNNKEMACKFFVWFTSTETTGQVDKFLSLVDTNGNVIEQAYDYWVSVIFTPDTI